MSDIIEESWTNAIDYYGRADTLFQEGKFAESSSLYSSAVGMFEFYIEHTPRPQDKRHVSLHIKFIRDRIDLLTKFQQESNRLSSANLNCNESTKLGVRPTLATNYDSSSSSEMENVTLGTLPTQTTDLRKGEHSQPKTPYMLLPECCICFDREAKWAVSPCGHMSYCEECIHALQEKKGLCTICKGPIHDSIKIYV